MGHFSNSWANPETKCGTAAINGRLAELNPALKRHFRRKMRDGNDVEDLVQEVFMRIFARQGSVVENLEGYAFQTAASVLADRHRRRTVRHADEHVPFEGDRHGGTDFDAGRIIESRETLKEVDAALTTLSDRTRKIFLMRRLEGRSYKEIALDIGISISAVEKRMVDAEKRLQLSPSYIQ